MAEILEGSLPDELRIGLLDVLKILAQQDGYTRLNQLPACQQEPFAAVVEWFLDNTVDLQGNRYGRDKVWAPLDYGDAGTLAGVSKLHRDTGYPRQVSLGLSTMDNPEAHGTIVANATPAHLAGLSLMNTYPHTLPGSITTTQAPLGSRLSYEPAVEAHAAPILAPGHARFVVITTG